MGTVGPLRRGLFAGHEVPLKGECALIPAVHGC